MKKKSIRKRYLRNVFFLNCLKQRRKELSKRKFITNSGETDDNKLWKNTSPDHSINIEIEIGCKKYEAKNQSLIIPRKLDNIFEKRHSPLSTKQAAEGQKSC